MESHGSSAELEEEELAQLVWQMKDAKSGLEVKERKAPFSNKVFKHSFVAKDAVSWLVDKKVALSREEAVQLSQQMLKGNFIFPATKSADDNEFSDGDQLFRFTEHEEGSLSLASSGDFDGSSYGSILLKIVPEKTKYNLCVLGSSGAGKSSFIKRFISGDLTEAPKPTTTDASFKKENFSISPAPTVELEIMDTPPRFILQPNSFDNEDFHSTNGYARSSTSELVSTNDSSQGTSIRTVNWSELLPKITINIDTNRSQSNPNDESKDEENNNSSNQDETRSNDDDFDSNSNSNMKNENENENVDQFQSPNSNSSSKDKHIRRPMNSFMLFSQEQRSKIHLANPNRDNRNVSKILGEKWYSLSAHEQEQYRIRAKQLKNQHFKQNPSFKWTNPFHKFANSQSNSISPKDHQDQCRRSARLQSQSNADKVLSPQCDRLQAFAQICTNMPKLTEESTQGFTPISKPSIDGNTSMRTNLITPVPIHANQIQTKSEINSSELFEFGNRSFRIRDSSSLIKSKSLSNSPELTIEKNFNENETYRTIFSMLINQRKTNLGLEQQLKHLQSNQKSSSPTTIQHQTNNKSFQIHINQIKDSFNPFLTHSINCSSSVSSGYSSGSSSTSCADSNSTILSAYSSRSNSSLSERSKTSPTPFKQNAIQYLPNLTPITTDEEVTQLTSNQNQPDKILNKHLTKRRKTVSSDMIQRPTTRSRSISERSGQTNSEYSPIVTRKRKASVASEQNPTEIKRTNIDYHKHLDEMKSQYMKSNSTRQMTNCHSLTNQIQTKNQYLSRLKVIDFLKDQLYPTDISITSFQQANGELFPTKRLLTQRIREIRQKLMSQLNQQQIQSESS